MLHDMSGFNNLRAFTCHDYQYYDCHEYHDTYTRAGTELSSYGFGSSSISFYQGVASQCGAFHEGPAGYKEHKNAFKIISKNLDMELDLLKDNYKSLA